MCPYYLDGELPPRTERFAGAFFLPFWLFMQFSSSAENGRRGLRPRSLKTEQRSTPELEPNGPIAGVTSLVDIQGISP